MVSKTPFFKEYSLDFGKSSLNLCTGGQRFTSAWGIGALNSGDEGGNGRIWEFGTKIGVEMRFGKKRSGQGALFPQM
jgi:hypothetical protein